MICKKKPEPTVRTWTERDVGIPEEKKKKKKKKKCVLNMSVFTIKLRNAFFQLKLKFSV